MHAAGVMVEQGFRVTAEKKFGGGTSAFSPAADWHGKYTNEWVFYYNRCASLYTYTHALPVFCVGYIARCLTGLGQITVTQGTKSNTLVYSVMSVGHEVEHEEHAVVGMWL